MAALSPGSKRTTRSKAAAGFVSSPTSVSRSVHAPDVTLEEVTTEAGREAFARFQNEHYVGDPHFVPPIIAERREFLDPASNPFFKHARVALFLARRHGRIVGRIAAINDERYNAFHDTDVGFFGLFESINEPAVAATLLDRAADWVRQTGPRTLIGPLNLAFHHDVGMLVEGFDRPPSMMMPYNPRGYGRLLEANGFVAYHDLYSYERLSTDPLPEKVARMAERIKATGRVRIRRVDLDDTEGEVRRIKAIYDSMLKPGWGFAPISDAEFDHAVARLKPLVVARPELCLIAETRGEPVAFSITVPDTNLAMRAANGYLSRFGLPIGLAKMLWAARKLDRVRVLLFGIKPGYRRRGIDALLAYETFHEAQRLGYLSGELGWVAEDDKLINRMVQSVGARHIKTFRLYQRAL